MILAFQYLSDHHTHQKNHIHHINHSSDIFLLFNFRPANIALFFNIITVFTHKVVIFRNIFCITP